MADKQSSRNALVHEERNKIEEKIDAFLEDGHTKTGLFLEENREKLPIFAPLGGCEKVISRKNTGNRHSGARIVLTRDNYGHRGTGFGGAGGTKCEAIDIVAGSLSAEEKLYVSSTKSRANFATDGARIYLTERGDINHYFGTANSDPILSKSSKGKSGIGIKSDTSLLIGRERVRILAGFGNFEGGEMLVNGNKNVKATIELGATTEDDYQQAVRGNNLVKYLKELNEAFLKMAMKIQTLETDLVQYKTAMALHTHTGAGVGAIITMPSLVAGIQVAKTVPDFLNKTVESIIDEYNRKITEYKALGIDDIGLGGSPEKYILSNTVYIGR